jgi:hypothetical protein
MKTPARIFFFLLLVVWLSNINAGGLALRAENTDLVSVLNLSKQAAQINNNWQDLFVNRLNKGQINQIAFNYNAKGSALAQAIRNEYIAPDLYDFVEDFNSNASSRMLSKADDYIEPSLKKENRIIIYPNPFTNELKVSYNFDKNNGGFIQLIEAGSGKTLLNTKFEQAIGESILNTLNIKNGVYILKVQQQGGEAIYTKLINAN